MSKLLRIRLFLFPDRRIKVPYTKFSYLYEIHSLFHENFENNNYNVDNYLTLLLIIIDQSSV